MQTLRDERIDIVRGILAVNPNVRFDHLSEVIVDSLDKHEAERHAHNSRFKITWDDETDPEESMVDPRQGILW